MSNLVLLYDPRELISSYQQVRPDLNPVLVDVFLQNIPEILNIRERFSE
jgi:hypothetical protein